jgi:hypothetical protein
MGKGKAKGSAGKGAGRGGFFGIFDVRVNLVVRPLFFSLQY